ncbi:1,2-diacylglycerol 3-beta-galactosyltransferase [Tistlia consotensis]|uniref:1,2-diacylglycerol 3-beta-galactosyltransferase n=1 Tax=Tistlia consotensis USBA 355 TaxID=560819 RepID=A0A1Y6BFF8_9PROT|nr:hypothetical protein [Tistlia consotensis]SMF04958.1 1,2-diacylglycerol 3-beta-galactosyltransferase [Tistlia consotensis USBA 355]SNR54950.1 1,2-diacylglycerol 3-beta-galactosyltransferase [Tistlia consotensis]
MGEDGKSDERHVVVVYTDAGGGHRAAAEALREILVSAGGFRVTLVNAYQEVLPGLDLFRRWTARDVEETYNELVLRRGHTGLLCLGFYLLAVLNVRLLGGPGRRAFRALWERSRPDLVLSVLPVINHLMIDSLAGYQGGRVPFAVLMTDWAELSRDVWFPRGRDYDAICGTERSWRQLARILPEGRRFRMAGLLLRPAFLDRPEIDVAAARREAGLDPDRPVACMLYGGYGSWRMLELAEALRDDPPDVQMIFLCGRNETLAEALSAAELPYPSLVLGFTREVHRYMAMSDLFIGKNGPLSVSEALTFGLPLLVDSHRVMPQERAVLHWIRRAGAGATFATPRHFARALRRLLAGSLAPTEEAAAQGRNAAARQIPEILRRILGRSGN